MVQRGDLSHDAADPDAAEMSPRGTERADERSRVGGEIAQVVRRRLWIERRRGTTVAQVVGSRPCALVERLVLGEVCVTAGAGAWQNTDRKVDLALLRRVRDVADYRGMTATRTIDVRADVPVLPAPRRMPVRLQLLGRSASMMFTSLTGAVLFSAWITGVALAPITLSASLLVPISAVVRRYANAHRREAAVLLGTPIPAPYRTDEQRPGVFGRIATIIKDPASWRDARWLLLHSIVACLTSALAVTLFVGSVFYLIYPFLFWVTPQRVFGRPFGGWHELHSVADATMMMPFALVSFGLWLVLQVPLTRAELALTRSLLGPRTSSR
jgi:hypothetical protein